MAPPGGRQNCRTTTLYKPPPNPQGGETEAGVEMTRECALLSPKRHHLRLEITLAFHLKMNVEIPFVALDTPPLFNIKTLLEILCRLLLPFTTPRRGCNSSFSSSGTRPKLWGGGGGVGYSEQEPHGHQKGWLQGSPPPPLCLSVHATTSYPTFLSHTPNAQEMLLDALLRFE